MSSQFLWSFLKNNTWIQFSWSSKKKSKILLKILKRLKRSVWGQIYEASDYLKRDEKEKSGLY